MYQRDPEGELNRQQYLSLRHSAPNTVEQISSRQCVFSSATKGVQGSGDGGTVVYPHTELEVYKIN